MIYIQFNLFPKVNCKFAHKNIKTGMVKVGHMKKRSSEAMNVWFWKFHSKVDENVCSQYAFYKSTNIFQIDNSFSGRVIFSISTTIFWINNFFSNLKTFQIEKSLLNQHKNKTSRNIFQIQKINRNCEIFVKPKKKNQTIQSF